LGQLYDYTVGLLGASGTPADARAALGAVGTTGDQTIAGVKTFSQPPRWGVDGSRGITLAPGTDLNTITDAGWYDVNTTVNAPAGTADWIHLTVSRGHNVNWVLQTVVDLHTDRIWFRRSQNSGGVAVWQPWLEMLHRGNGVALSGNQTVGGVKTFSSPPVVPGLTPLGGAPLAIDGGSAASVLRIASSVANGYMLLHTVNTASGQDLVQWQVGHEGSEVLTGNERAGGALSFTTGGWRRLRIAADGAQSSVIPGGVTLYPEFKCRAWVNFNGTGTVAIRASGNVSSITDNGVGDYTVNFTTAMPDTSYGVVGATDSESGFGRFVSEHQGGARTPSGVRVILCDGTANRIDQPVVSVAIFR